MIEDISLLESCLDRQSSIFVRNSNLVILPPSFAVKSIIMDDLSFFYWNCKLCLKTTQCRKTIVFGSPFPCFQAKGSSAPLQRFSSSVWTKKLSLPAIYPKRTVFTVSFIDCPCKQATRMHIMSALWTLYHIRDLNTVILLRNFLSFPLFSL